jgi:hypothetical protein
MSDNAALAAFDKDSSEVKATLPTETVRHLRRFSAAKNFEDLPSNVT